MRFRGDVYRATWRSLFRTSDEFAVQDKALPVKSHFRGGVQYPQLKTNGDIRAKSGISLNFLQTPEPLNRKLQFRVCLALLAEKVRISGGMKVGGSRDPYCRPNCNSASLPYSHLK